jgi:hypothetical protein
MGWERRSSGVLRKREMPLILILGFAISAIMALFTEMPYNNAFADELLNQKQRALELIANTADRICGEAQTSGNIENSELQGKIEGQLKGLASKLAEAGISGSGKITNEQYQGVVRSELASTLHDIRQCKLKILERLQEQVLGPSSQSQGGGEQSRPITGKRTDIIQGRLIPGHDDSPPVVGICKEYLVPGALAVYLGTQSVAIASNFPTTILRIYGKGVLQINRDANGYISINLMIVGDDGREIVRIDDNVFTANRNNSYGMEWPDLSSLVVIDRNKDKSSKLNI